MAKNQAKQEIGSIRICGLGAIGFHGVYDFERAEGQKFVIDLEISLPMPPDDELIHTVDYSKLVKEVLAIVEGEPVNLIETLAQRVADRCLAEPLVVATKVSVHKPQAPLGIEVNDVMVTITRRKNE